LVSLAPRRSPHRPRVFLEGARIFIAGTLQRRHAVAIVSRLDLGGEFFEFGNDPVTVDGGSDRVRSCDSIYRGGGSPLKRRRTQKRKRGAVGTRSHWSAKAASGPCQGFGVSAPRFPTQQATE
jgi:hypothetical protein